jgi:transketolase
MTLEKLCIDTVRCLSMDAVQRASSGHPGAAMALAPAGYALWTKALRHSPSNPGWANRDRFVLSCGHVSMLLYSMLYLTGYGLELSDIKDFRQWGSRTPGHPEYGATAGVETTTGPLGQGIGNAVGIAMAERWLASRFNRPGFDVIDHHTYAFAGDGDLMEGVGMEATSLAGHLGLGKLVVLWDDNRITIEGGTDLAISDDISMGFRSQGWNVLEVDGQDAGAIAAALLRAREPSGKPTLIACRTIIGWPAPNKQNSADAHGAPLGAEEVRAAKRALGWDPDKEFVVPEEALAEYRKCVPRGAEAEGEWNRKMEAYGAAHPGLAKELKGMLSGDLGGAWRGALPSFDAGGSLATREASGRVLNAVAGHIPQLVGGSADLGPSNNTIIKGGGDFTGTGSGRNIHFGVREHAMGAVLNGMFLHGGLRPYGGTFLVFCDYMRPSMRLAALMKLPVLYVFTHDSIGVGEDGPTHQPIEQTMSLRLIPGLTVIRPADAGETVHAWSHALGSADGPVALILTRQKLPVLDAAKTAGAARGGYVLEEASGPPSAPAAVLVATGSEVHLALKARTALEARGVPTRVVSLPSWELFDAQDSAYRESVLPGGVPTVSIEAGVTSGWRCHAHSSIGMDRFGVSAPSEVLFERLGFTPERVVEEVERLRLSRAGGAH